MGMVKCIEREAAVNAILKLVPKVDDDGYCWVIRGDVARAIDSIPAADVRLVQHGVWLKIKYRSICRDCSFRGFASWNYCPNCGRQMATEGENG